MNDKVKAKAEAIDKQMAKLGVRSRELTVVLSHNPDNVIESDRLRLAEYIASSTRNIEPAWKHITIKQDGEDYICVSFKGPPPVDISIVLADP